MRRAPTRVAFALALLAATAAPVRAVGVLSNGSVTPLSGTTATSFVFSVDYLSTDSPRRPAQLVWAEAGGMTVPLLKVSGTSHDGTWQGSSTLPAGAWTVTFHATTSAGPQPLPLPGPVVLVTAEPTPSPTPTPAPTQPPTATPRATPRPTPSPPPTATNPPPPPTSGTAPTEPAGGDPPESGSPDAASTAEASASDGPPDPRASAGATDDGREVGAGVSPGGTEPASGDEPDEGQGGLLAPFLFVGGTMSIVGAAVLARQWAITRSSRR